MMTNLLAEILNVVVKQLSRNLLIMLTAILEKAPAKVMFFSSFNCNFSGRKGGLGKRCAHRQPQADSTVFLPWQPTNPPGQRFGYHFGISSYLGSGMGWPPCIWNHDQRCVPGVHTGTYRYALLHSMLGYDTTIMIYCNMKYILWAKSTYFLGHVQVCTFIYWYIL